MDKDTVIGPLARKDLLLELEDQIRRILEQGGRILCGGKRMEEGALIMQATLISNLPYDAPVLDEEWFGPVIPLIPFRDEAEVLKMANHTAFGLGASVWTGDPEKAARMAKKIEAGTVALNGMVKSEPGLPFGGIKASGYGRELAEYGMKEFLNTKTVNHF
jgi:acyl-CoA reductase-like NAD-dependent aldehyde dehydrogenase